MNEIIQCILSTDYNLVDSYAIQIKLKIKSLKLLIAKNVI